MPLQKRCRVPCLPCFARKARKRLPCKLRTSPSFELGTEVDALHEVGCPVRALHVRPAFSVGSTSVQSTEVLPTGGAPCFPPTSVPPKETQRRGHRSKHRHYQSKQLCRVSFGGYKE